MFGFFVLCTDHDLLNIGDGVVLGEDAVPHPLYYLEGSMHIAKIHINEGASMSDRAILLGGASLDSNERLDTLQVKARKLPSSTSTATATTAVSQGLNVKKDL